MHVSLCDWKRKFFFIVLRTPIPTNQPINQIFIKLGLSINTTEVYNKFYQTVPLYGSKNYTLRKRDKHRRNE